MTTIRKRVKAAAVGAAIALTIAMPAAAETIYEDDPRWDCHTMGNGICGPGHILNGREIVALIGLEVW